MEFTFSKIVRQVLNESFQDFEYHFTSLDNLVRICQTGRIPLSHTDFWQITEADNFDKEDFVNTMIDYVEGSIDGKERNVRGNDIERFRKYLQHLTHKCTVEQMFSLFKKLDIDPSESFSNQWTDFKYKKLNYFDATYMWFPKYSGLSYDQRDKYRKDNEKEITQYYFYVSLHYIHYILLQFRLNYNKEILTKHAPNRKPVVTAAVVQIDVVHVLPETDIVLPQHRGPNVPVGPVASTIVD